MSTAWEIEVKAAAAKVALVPITKNIEAIFKDLVTYGAFAQLGREVCARRARVLRKRGEHVKFSKNTQTGKARYVWMRRVNIHA